MAPAGAPAPVMAQLRKAMATALNDPAVIERVKQYGAIASYGGEQDYAKLLQDEFAKWQRVVKDGNIKVN